MNAKTVTALPSAIVGTATPDDDVQLLKVPFQTLQCRSSLHSMPSSAGTKFSSAETSNISLAVAPANTPESIPVPAQTYYIQNYQPVPSAGFVQPMYNPFQQRVLMQPVHHRGNMVYRYLSADGETTCEQSTLPGTSMGPASACKRSKSAKNKKVNNRKVPSSKKSADSATHDESSESLKAAIARQRKVISQLVKIIVNEKLGKDAFAADEGKEATDAIEQQQMATINMGDNLSQRIETAESKSDLQPGAQTGATRLGFPCKNEDVECTMREYLFPKEICTVSQNIDGDMPVGTLKKTNKGRSRGKSRDALADRQLEELGRKAVELLSPTKSSELHNLREEFARQLKSLKQVMEQDDTTPDADNFEPGAKQMLDGASTEQMAAPRQVEQQEDIHLPTYDGTSDNECSAEKDGVGIEDVDEFLNDSTDENVGKDGEEFSTPIANSKQQGSANSTASTGKGKRKKKTNDFSYASTRLQEDDIVETECRRSPRKRPKTTAPSRYVRRSASKQATEKISNLLKGTDEEPAVSDVLSDCKTEEDERKARRTLLPPEFDPVLECVDGVELEVDKQQNVSEADEKRSEIASFTTFPKDQDGEDPVDACYAGCSPDIVEETCLDDTVEWSVPRSVRSAASLSILGDPSPRSSVHTIGTKCSRELEISPLGFSQPLDLTSQAIMKSSTFFAQAEEFQTQALDLRVPSRQPSAEDELPPGGVARAFQLNSPFRPIVAAKTLAETSADVCTANSESFVSVKSPCDESSEHQSCSLKESRFTEQLLPNSDSGQAENDGSWKLMETARFNKTYSSDHFDGGSETWEPGTGQISDETEHSSYPQFDFTLASSPQRSLRDWLARRRKFPNSLFSLARGHGIGFLRRTRAASETGAGSTFHALRKVNRAKSIWRRIADAGKLDVCVAPGKRGRRRKIYRERAALTLADTPPVTVSSSDDYESPKQVGTEKKMKKLKKRRDYKTSRLVKKTSKSKNLTASAGQFPFVVAGQTTESSEVDAVSESSYSVCKSNDDSVGVASLRLPLGERESPDSTELLLQQRLLQLKADFANSDREDDFQPGQLSRLNGVFSKIRAQIGKARVCRRERELLSCSFSRPNYENSSDRKAGSWNKSNPDLSDIKQPDVWAGIRKSTAPPECETEKEIDKDKCASFPSDDVDDDATNIAEIDRDHAICEDSLAIPQYPASDCVVNICPLQYSRSGAIWAPDKNSESSGRSPLRKTFVRNKNSYSVRDTTDEESRFDQSAGETKVDRQETDSEESDVSSKSSEASIAEWTMVPRRACSEAKKKISQMIQLAGSNSKKSKRPFKVASGTKRENSLRKKRDSV